MRNETSSLNFEGLSSIYFQKTSSKTPALMQASTVIELRDDCEHSSSLSFIHWLRISWILASREKEGKRETVKQNVLAVNLPALLIRTLKLSAIASCGSLLLIGVNLEYLRSDESPNTGTCASTPSWLHRVHQNLGSPPLEGYLAYGSLKPLDSPDWYCCFK